MGSLLFADIAENQEAGPLEAFFSETDPVGFVIVSQTCDIVSDESRLEFVVVCPLVVVDTQRVNEISRGRVSRLGFVEHAPEGTVADFARPMTITKKLLATWDRIPGFTDQGKAQAFARSLERHFGRFAFPDNFNKAIRPLLEKVISKYGKADSPLGKAARSLTEIRVRPSTDWNSEQVSVQFILIVSPKERRLLEPAAIKSEFEGALNSLPWGDGVMLDDPAVRLGGYDDFLARDYVESFSLDLNAISFAARYAGGG